MKCGYRLKKIITAIMLGVLFCGQMMLVTEKRVSAAGDVNKVCSELSGADDVDQSVLDAAGCSGPTGSNKNIAALIDAIITVAISMVGVISMGAIVIAGQRYIVSGGDAGKIASAKKMMVYAVVAIIVALLAFAIVKFVIASLG